MWFCVCVFNKHNGYKIGIYTVRMAAEQEAKLMSSPFEDLLLNDSFASYSDMSDQLRISSCALLTLVVVRFSNRSTLDVVLE